MEFRKSSDDGLDCVYSEGASSPCFSNALRAVGNVPIGMTNDGKKRFAPRKIDFVEYALEFASNMDPYFNETPIKSLYLQMKDRREYFGVQVEYNDNKIKAIKEDCYDFLSRKDRIDRINAHFRYNNLDRSIKILEENFSDFL